MTAPEQIMAEELAEFYSSDGSYVILSPPSDGLLTVADVYDMIPVTVAVIDNFSGSKTAVKWGVMDTGQRKDGMIWFVENEALADKFIANNASWKKVRRIIIDTGWTEA